MKKFFIHISSCILRGILAIIPIFLCWAALWLMRKFIDEQVLKFLSQYIDIRQIPGLGIVLLLAFLYVIGLIFSNVLGRQIFMLIDAIAQRIPIIKIIYGVGKQFSETLSVADPQKQAFKKAVFVESFNGQGWMLGFITGSAKGLNGEDLLKVYVPSSPHPLTGIVFFVKPSQILDCGWTVEEALKMIVSVGIISPEEIKKVN
ncbi:MAG: DUF502 domain-containing protein [Candidatus Omnitrophica bacterium]|nr:DUF502 domain-containing protein [Candidatus Omnitrophota bacterium]MDE2009632.1 DUF502 domain-containing protein [Candidatus Omnitrophota bacterium]MDE2214440.1 DUF502 domain-containing protein [Candidatus Omnitrophota bacterium]MDE2231580.1 DUF502 domain-containing protein [Candidatus Omnitrophota bacterium]